MARGRGLRSRQERREEQRHRMGLGRRNLSQLVGPQGQGGRTPMQRGYTSSSLQPPKFPQSDPVADLTQAGLAYKGGKGLFDWTQGAEAYTDKAGKFHKAVKPYGLPDGGSMLDPLKGLFGNDGSVTMTMTQNPPAASYGPAVNNEIIPGSQFAQDAASKASPKAQMMRKAGLIPGGTVPEAGTGIGNMLTPAEFNFLDTGLTQTGIAQGMGDAVSASSAGSNLPSGGGAFSGSSNIASSGTSGANQLATKSLDASKAAGTDALGAAGSALGVGLNIYDMVDNGVNISNSLGLGGSALLGANALGIGLANSWNPLGWAMLAGSIGSSFF